MPVGFLTDAERERLDRFPSEVTQEDVIAFFTLSPTDRDQIPKNSGAHNRLGVALQLGALRFLGFCPDDLGTAPPVIVEYLAIQLGISVEALAAYGGRDQTRTNHLRHVQAYLGFRRANVDDVRRLGEWLLERALKHDRPSLLLHLACEHLHASRIVRPGITQLERIVAAARHKAQAEIFTRLGPVLESPQVQSVLDRLLVADPATGRTPLTWLRHGATATTPSAILGSLEKLAKLRAWGVEAWDLSAVNPNRRQVLARVGKRSTNQALERMAAQRRYPILLAFLRQALEEITDETIDLYDRCLAEAYARARRDLDEFRRSVARATNEKVRLLADLGRIVLDPDVSDPEVRGRIYSHVTPERLRAALDECDRITRPIDDNYFDLLNQRYAYLRQFAPAFLEHFVFRASRPADDLLEAIDVVRKLNSERRRKIAEDDQAPTDFVPPKWRPYVLDEQERIDRRYYELCVLWELRGALRAGNVWVEGSRRYADPEGYLIDRDIWPDIRQQTACLVGAPVDGAERLTARSTELDVLLARLDQTLGRVPGVRIENGAVVVTPLKAEERTEATTRLERLIDERVPRIELAELLIEVDAWTSFTACLEHAGGSEPRSKDLLVHLYAALLAQGCNLGLTTMAQIADLSRSRLTWCATWYLREETLAASNAILVNAQHQHPLSRVWGGGTLSSSDGQRFPVAVRTRTATALPRYFGYGRGLTFYTWTSDQYSQYGTKVIASTVRDATYVLDEILDNETELPILEHTTDTSGYTDLVFALFDLLGMRFSPRIADLGDQRLYRVDRGATYEHLGALLKGTISKDLILRDWDQLLRVAGSLKLGWVTASLLIGKLQAFPRQNSLTRVLQEYGRLVKTIFILKYIESEEYRRRIGAQLNKGEALHALRRFLFFGNDGRIRQRHAEGQMNQAGCLNLITNAVVVWNTVYMQAVIDDLKAVGEVIDADAVAHLSPARYEHINPYGKFKFTLSTDDDGRTLRPLRKPETKAASESL